MDMEKSKAEKEQWKWCKYGVCIYLIYEIVKQLAKQMFWETSVTKDGLQEIEKGNCKCNT